jgi:hypothetical protein
MRGPDGRALDAPRVVGILAGLAVIYLTGLLVSV